MKIIFEFNKPEDNEDLAIHMKAIEYHIVIYELDNYLRAKLKYEELTEEQSKLVSEIRNKLTELRNENGINE
jgi:hypothetical protein